MTSQQKLILGAGLAAGFLIYQSKKTAIDPKTGKPIAKSGLLSNLLPVRGTNSTGVASTNMATRNGTATAPRVPSSGLGYGTAPRGVAQAPTTAAGVAAASANVFSSLLNFLARKQPAPTGPKPSTSAGGSRGGSSGSSGGSSGGGGGSRSGGNSSPLGGAAGVAAGGNSDSSTPIQGGSFDPNTGEWVTDDSSSTGIQGGSFDDAGNWIPDDTASYEPGGENFVGPVDTSSYEPGGADFVGPQDQPGAVDENGNFDPNAEGADEVLYSNDVLPSTPIGNGDFAPGDSGFDPIVADAGDANGVDDGNYPVDEFATVSGGGGGGGGEEDNSNWWDE